MSIYINTKYSYEFYALKVHTQTIEIPFIHCFGYNFRINIPKIWFKIYSHQYYYSGVIHSIISLRNTEHILQL